MPAHPCEHVCGAAAENLWNIDAAADCDVRARAAQPLADFQHRPCFRFNRAIHLYRRVIQRQCEQSAPVTANTASASNRMCGPTSVTSSVAVAG